MLLPRYWQLPEPHSCHQGCMARHHHACLSLSNLCPRQAPNSQLEVEGAPESFPILSPLGVTGLPRPSTWRLKGSQFAVGSEPCGASSSELKSDRA